MSVELEGFHVGDQLLARFSGLSKLSEFNFFLEGLVGVGFGIAISTGVVLIEESEVSFELGWSGWAPVFKSIENAFKVD